MTGGDIAVRDAVIAPGPRRTARNTLDRQLIRAQAARARDGFPIHVAKVSSGDSSRSGLTGLQKACIRALCANVGDDGVLDLLAEGRMPERFLLPFVAQLQRAFGADGLPFRVWKRLVQTYDTLPARVKTYRGVVLDDTDQLQRLHLFDASFSFAPPVTVVTLLDLSNTAFDRMDAYKIKVALSRTLVALRLDRLRTFDDDGIADLARGASDGEGAFPNLEILTLRGCNLVTDRSAAKLIGFPALKMLDLRDTSCTSATKDILRRASRPPFFAAFTSPQLALFTLADLSVLSRSLQALSLQPLRKSDDSSNGSVLLESTVAPSLLITELTRLDQDRLHNPLDLHASRATHRVSHGTFGTIYSTARIDRATVKSDAKDQPGASRDDRAEVARARLLPSQVDYGWQRKRTQIREARLQDSTARNGGEELLDLDSDLEDAGDASEEPAIRPEWKLDGPHEALRSFYNIRHLVTSATASTPVLPEKSDLMLLRFSRSDEPATAERVQPAKRRAENIDPVRLVVKKASAAGGSPGPASTAGFLRDLVGCAPRSVVQASGTAVPASSQRTAPAGIGRAGSPLILARKPSR